MSKKVIAMSEVDYLGLKVLLNENGTDMSEFSEILGTCEKCKFSRLCDGPKFGQPKEFVLFCGLSNRYLKLCDFCSAWEGESNE